MKKGLCFGFVACFTLLLFLVSAWASDTVVNRCLKYRSRVIREARYHIGLNAPAHLFLGQIEQESRCDAGITAFDGGMGLGQFMPETAEWMQAREAALRELQFNPYDPVWAIRAVILYDDWLYGVVVCKGWYFTFRAYNGGPGLLNKEISRAGTCDIKSVEAECKRKILKLKSGPLDLCRVNCMYPRQIEAKGAKYR